MPEGQVSGKFLSYECVACGERVTIFKMSEIEMSMIRHEVCREHLNINPDLLMLFRRERYGFGPTPPPSD